MKVEKAPDGRVLFTKEMRKTHKIYDGQGHNDSDCVALDRADRTPVQPCAVAGKWQNAYAWRNAAGLRCV